MIQTPFTKRLGITHPILLAGMANISKADLAAAVSNAGGLGVVGGAFITPTELRKELKMLKEKLNSPDLPFGVDLLLPKIGGGARATNHDYTNGTIYELVQVMIEEGCKIFVCAVGVPPKAVVDQLHSAGIMVMNMVGSAKHVPKALAVGVDAICAQGTEAGGHTGDIATMPLIPQCVDACRGKTSPLHGGPVAVVGAGGIFDGRGLAAALSLGAEAVWVGTRFVASTEATAGPRHKNFIVKTNSDETVRTLIFSGRPMRVFKSNYIQDWQSKRPLERDELLKSGKRPYKTDLVANDEKGTPLDFIETYPMIYGQSCGGIDEILPAKDIVLNMVNEATKIIQNNTSFLISKM